MTQHSDDVTEPMSERRSKTDEEQCSEAVDTKRAREPGIVRTFGISHTREKLKKDAKIVGGAAKRCKCYKEHA